MTLDKPDMLLWMARGSTRTVTGSSRWKCVAPT
nr:MAG TPA: hypothetical protein [Caudoviricetes sp.]